MIIGKSLKLWEKWNLEKVFFSSFFFFLFITNPKWISQAISFVTINFYIYKNAYTNPPSVVVRFPILFSSIISHLSAPPTRFSTFNLLVARLDPLLTEAEQSLAIFVRSHDDIFGAGRRHARLFFGPLTTTQRGWIEAEGGKKSEKGSRNC